MSKNNPLNDDEALRDLLQEWKVKEDLPPRFQEQVWRRIDESTTPRPLIAPTPWAALRNWIGNALPRPAFTAAYMAILLAVGAGMGWAQAQHERTRVSHQLSARYVKLADPFLRAH